MENAPLAVRTYNNSRTNRSDHQGGHTHPVGYMAKSSGKIAQSLIDNGSPSDPPSLATEVTSPNEPSASQKVKPRERTPALAERIHRQAEFPRQTDGGWDVRVATWFVFARLILLGDQDRHALGGERECSTAASRTCANDNNFGVKLRSVWRFVRHVSQPHPGGGIKPNRTGSSRHGASPLCAAARRAPTPERCASVAYAN